MASCSKGRCGRRGAPGLAPVLRYFLLTLLGSRSLGRQAFVGATLALQEASGLLY